MEIKHCCGCCNPVGDCTCRQFTPTEADKVKIVEMAAKSLTALTLQSVDASTVFGVLSDGRTVRMRLSFVDGD